MTQQSAPVIETSSPLVAAQKIVATLQGMPKPDQSLAIKFALETLRLDLTTSLSSSVVPPAHQADQRLPGSVTAVGQQTDIKQFTTSKAPKSDQQFAAVVAYFYQFEAPTWQRKDSIDATTMKDAARLVVWGQVKDWNMTLNNAKRAGYLDPADRGTFKLSSVGENLVAITLPGNGAVGIPKGSSAKKKPSAKRTAGTKSSKRVE